MVTSKTALCVMSLVFVGITHAGEAGDPGKAKSESCSSCHGEDGNPGASLFPKLAGQHATYLAKQLRDYRSETRVQATMNAMASGLSDDDIADLAAYFAKQTIKPETTEPSSLGEKIFRAGHPENGVPACSGCHGPGGKGNPQAIYPALAGQYAAYLSKTLNDYKRGERNSGPNAIMGTIASRLSEEEINAVADYAAGLQ